MLLKRQFEMDKKCGSACDQDCVSCNSTMVLPNQLHQLNHSANSFASPVPGQTATMKTTTKQTRTDQAGLNGFITEVTTSSIESSNRFGSVNSNLTRNLSMRSSKSSQNIQQYAKTREQQQLDYYHKILLNNQANEQQLYYSFLRLYVDALSGYTNQEIYHMVVHHNPRIKQFSSGTLIRLPTHTWFIIVTGSVYINGRLYLPHSS